MNVVSRLLTFCILLSVGSVFAQGMLTPPGAPAPVMKTLDQIYTEADQAETRIAIKQSDIPFAINTAGSYYLAEHIDVPMNTVGIEVNVPGVTIDLNGFALKGAGKTTGTTGSGIRLNPSSHGCQIRNGAIINFRQLAIDGNSGGNNCVFENLYVAECGLAGAGGSLGAIFRNCAAYSNGGAGLAGSVGSIFENCQANYNSAAGIAGSSNTRIAHCSSFSNVTGFAVQGGSTVQNCVAHNNASIGIEATQNCLILNSTVTSTTLGNGIVIQTGSMVSDCIVSDNSQYGIFASTTAHSLTVRNCHVKDNTFDGIRLEGGNALVENNNVYSNSGNGIYTNTGATIRNNHVYGNTTAGIRVGPLAVVTSNTVTSNATGLLCTVTNSYFQQNVLRGNTTNESLGGSTEGAGVLANVAF